MTDEPNDPQGGPEGGESHDIRRLREKADRTDQLERELADARREAAVAKSGIDTDSPLGKMFLRAYEGDPSDVDAMVAAAKEVGVPFRSGQPDASGNAGDQPGGGTEGEGGSTEPTGTDERQQLAGGAPPDTGEQPDPNAVALDQFQKDMAAGMPEDDARAKFLGTLATAAQAGDRRVLVKERS